MAATRPKKSSFKARIRRAAMFFVVDVPPAVSHALGKTAHVPVVVAIGGGPGHRTTLLPQGAGRHLLPLNGKMRRASNAGEGDIVAITLSLDNESRHVEAPGDLVMALRDEGVHDAFEAITPGRRRQYILWLEAAVHETTRDKRIARLVEIALAAREKAIDEG